MGNVSARAAVGIVAFATLVGCGTYAALSWARDRGGHAAIPQYGNIFQSGALVGWATGARLSASDTAVVEFEQIAHARQLLQQDAFEYSGLKMRIVQVAQVDYPPGTEGAARSGPPRPDKTLLRVTARIQSPR